jgi:hypothetical protein
MSVEAEEGALLVDIAARLRSQSTLLESRP